MESILWTIVSFQLLKEPIEASQIHYVAMQPGDISVVIFSPLEILIVATVALLQKF